MRKSNHLFSTRNLVLMGVLSALAAVLMFFKLPVFFAPGFYTLDASEIPILIGAFAMGPLSAIVMEFLKIVLNLLMNGSLTAGVGEFANFIGGIAFVLPAALIYHHNKSKKSAMIGLIIGIIVMTTVNCFVNAYMTLPLYAKAMNCDISVFIQQGREKNDAIQNMRTFIMLAVLPFNLLKSVTSSIITMLLYKHVAPIIKGRN